PPPRSSGDTRKDAADGPLVGSAGGHRVRPDRVYRLFDLGRVPKRQLLHITVPLPVLFALPGHQVRGRPGRLHHNTSADGWVIRAMVDNLAGDHRTGRAARLPPDLLLLPQSLLPLALAGPGRVRGPGTPQPLHWRDPVPPHCAKCAPLVLL